MNIKKKMLNSLLGMVLAVTLVLAPVLSDGALTSSAFAEEEQQAAQDTKKAEVVVEGENTGKPAEEPSAEKKDAPKEAASPAKSTDQKADEKVEEPAPADTKTTYEWKDDQVKVTAVLSDAAAIPDDAKLIATAVKKDSQHYNYKAYLDALNKGSESSYDESNTLLYDIAFIKDGKEVQPVNGTVSVTIDFLASQLSKSLGAEKASDVNVIHLPLTDSVKDKYATTADATKISAGDVKVENIAKTGASGEELKFVASNFSVFAYTVDFEHDGYTFSMPGNGTIALSELFAQLHIDKNVADAAAVTFSNPELLTVEKTEGDWTLTSKQAFKSEEKLTVEMKDGEKIEVKVTDNQDVALEFLNADGTPGDASGVSGYKLLLRNDWGGGNKGLATLSVSGNTATAADLPDNSAPNQGDGFYLLKTSATDIATINSVWDYDPTGIIAEKKQLNSGAEVGAYTVTAVTPNKITLTKKVGYTVNLVFWEHDYDPENPGSYEHVIPGESGGAQPFTQHAYVRVLLRDEDNAIVGYAISSIPTASDVNSVVLDTFTMLNGGTMSYSDAKAAGYSVTTSGSNVRVGYKDQNQTPSYDDFDNQTNGLSTGDPDGYTFAGQERVNDDERTVNLRVSDPAEYWVAVDCGDEPLTLPSDTDVYVLAKITTSNNNTLYGYAKLDSSMTSDGGKTYKVQIPNNMWFEETGYQTYRQGNNQISGHEAKITASLAVVPSGTSVSNPTPLISNTVPNDGVVQTHDVVSYPTIENGNFDPEADPVQRTYVNYSGEKSVYTDYIYLEKNDDKFDLYTLETLLNGGYNVVTLCPGENGSMPKEVTTISPENSASVGQGDAYIGCHQMGGILIRGDVTFAGKVTGVADSPDADNPSVVGGYFGDTSAHGCFVNNRTNNTDIVDFYVGSSNSIAGNLVNGIEYSQEMGGTQHGINYPGATIVSDDYLDWNRLQSMINTTSSSLANISTRTITAAGEETVDVQLGERVIIDCPADASITVNIVGEGAEAYDAKGTVISFLNDGDAKIPTLKVNGKTLNTDETGEGMSVVWNYPNATGTVQGPSGSEFGHVLAPKALIKITGGNYSGTMVGNNAYIGADAEGHLYPYRGGSLIPAEFGFVVGKTVNGEEPTEEQVYSFNLYELTNGSWGDPIQTKQNNKREIMFDQLEYTASGEHWYLMNEDPESVTSGTSDDTLYLIHVVVEKQEDTGEDDVFTQTHMAYKAKVTNKNALIKEDGTIDMNQIEVLDETAVDGGVSSIVFRNTEEDQKGSLKITKTWLGDDIGEEAKKGLEITIAGKDINKTEGAQDKDTLTITYADFDEHGEYIVDDLPVGETYDVAEMNTGTIVTGYTFVIADSVITGSGSIEAGKLVLIALTNKYTQDTAKLKVKKSFADNTLTDAEKAAIEFKVEGPEGFETRTKTYAEFENGIWDLGEVLPGEYTVSESNAEKDGYALSTTYKINDEEADEPKTALAKDEEATIELINAYIQDKGSLTVTKNVSGAPKTAKDKEFKFTVQVKGGSDYVQKDGTLAAKAYEFSVKGGETAKIENIPVGDYVVTENTKDAAIKGYALKATGGGNVTITKNGTAASKLTNTYTEEKEEKKSSKGTKTGDDGGIWWFIIAAFSLQAMLMWAGMEAKRKARARK